MYKRPVVCLIGNDAETLCRFAVALHKPHFDTRCFSSVPQFLAEVPPTGPGCAILDCELAGDERLQLLRHLREANSPLTVLVFGSTTDPSTAVSLMQHGASVLIDKPIDVTSTLEVVERALLLSVERYLKRQHVASIRKRLSTLLPEEHSVLKLLLEGVPNKGVASSLNLSMRTVDRRRHTLLEKMQVGSLPEVARLLGELDAQ